MANEIVLVEYEKACRQVARAVSANEIMKIKEQADIMNACAKVIKNKKLEADAWELRIRAERRLGEMLRDGKDDRASVGRPNKSISEKGISKPTLKEMKITDGLATRARRLAELPSDKFGIMIVDGRFDVTHSAENSSQLKEKSKKKPKPQREFECPHCGKAVYLKEGRLEK